MKRVVCIMFLVTALISANVWALTWNPDADADLKFNMNFENKDVVAPYSTTDVEGGVVGTLEECNEAPSWDPNSFWNSTNAIRGNYSGDFGYYNDRLWWGRSPNDVNVILGDWGVAQSNRACFEIGLADSVKRTFAFWFNDADINEPGSPTDYDKLVQGDANYAGADGNYPQAVDGNAPGYLWQRRFTESTIFRYANRLQPRMGLDKDKWWQIAINNGKLEFREGRGHVYIQTPKILTELGRPGVPDDNGWVRTDSNGCDPNTWHHAVIVLDRTAADKMKIYIDGVDVGVNIINYQPGMDSVIDSSYRSCGHLGGGAKSGSPKLPGMLNGYEFDGMLDEVRVYTKALTAQEANILYQWDSDDPNTAIAIVPLANQQNVAMNTGLEWDPATYSGGITKQEIYFGTDASNLSLKRTYNNGTSRTVANSYLNGGKLLTPGIAYYWRVDSTVTGVGIVPSTTWMFTVESGKAYNPTPADYAVDINNIGTTSLYWNATLPSGSRTFDVYFSTDESLVEASSGTVRVRDDISVTQALDINTPTPGMVYYWRVNTYYANTNPAVEVAGDVWQFRTEPYKLIFNTGPGDVNYLDKGHMIPSLECHLKQGSAWAGSAVMTGTLKTDGVAIFTKTGDFSYDSQYDIIVVPDYIPANDDVNGVPTPLAIHITGDFYFDGMLNISGDDTSNMTSSESPKARCGGHRGPRKENSPGDFKPELPLGYYYKKLEWENRYGQQRAHYYCVPTTTNNVNTAKPSGYSVFGPGSSNVAPYKDSGGAGYGGAGGDSGRGWTQAIYCGGATYGDKEVPVPFGGSAAAWSQHNAGGAGGGGVEIVAANVEFGSNAKIYAKGGTHPWVASQYPSGGGSGGSVKVVTAGNFINNGDIDVSGGRGQDASEKGNNAAGGGGGGRVAVFYGGSLTQGTILADGGDKGLTVGSGTYPLHNGLSMALPGEDGTIYVNNSATVSPLKASAPTPKNGERYVYAGPSGKDITLKWYAGFAGYNGTVPTSDQVYFGTSVASMAAVGTARTTPARGERSASTTVHIDPDTTYYMKVVTNTTIDSNTWSFTTVGWECNEPDWDTYLGQPYDINDDGKLMAAGYPAWDQNHDCVVNNEDLWLMAERWQVNFGGAEYTIDMNQFEFFISQWLTCRARTDDGCDGWQPCPDWVPPGDVPGI